MDAKVLAARGNSYFVHVQSGAEVWKNYPTELHRIGPPTTEDHANGNYALHDRVLVNVQGQGWVPGEIVITKGMEYQVELAGNRTAWATPENLRLAPTAPAAAAPKGGQPPKPGLVSCAGKFEGRYASTGFPGNITIVFRSGKATMNDGFSRNDPELECWTGGAKIYLHKAGDSAADDFPIDINNDGTLQTPFGEVRKKGN